MIRVVQRGLAVLECFDTANPSLSLGKIAERVDLPKATVFRLLMTLVNAGYLMQLSDQEYALSPKLMRLAAVAQMNFSIRNVARGEMAALAAASRETVDLSMLSGTGRISIDVIESPHPLKNIIMQGENSSLAFGASGKAILAFADFELVERLIEENAPRIEREPFLQEMRSIRKNGYAYSSGERVPGASALAVPIHDHTDKVSYAIAITGPSFRFDPRKDEFIELLLSAGAAVSKRLGAPDVSRSA